MDNKTLVNITLHQEKTPIEDCSFRDYQNKCELQEIPIPTEDHIYRKCECSSPRNCQAYRTHLAEADM